MAALLPSAPVLQFTFKGKSGSCRLAPFSLHDKKRTRFQYKPFFVKAMCACSSSSKSQKKQVWIWTEKKEVMTAAVERGWNTFIFQPDFRQLAAEWSSIALLSPLFIEDGGVFDGEHIKVANIFEISSPEELEKLQLLTEQVENVVVNLLDWQVIPAENIVAAIQGTQKTVFAISKTSSEAQIFLEALEQGLGGVVLKTGDVEAIFELKDYLDRRNNEGSFLELTKATVTNIQMVGMGDRVCVDLCSLMKPGEGLLVGSFARGLFLVHSECLESNYISSRPFRVNAGPVHAYVAVPGGKTSYLSELKAGKEVLIVDQDGKQRTAIIGRLKIETRPLILVEAKTNQDSQTSYSILLQNAETVALISSPGGRHQHTAIPVTSLKLGDEILLRVQGGARHTGIEIQEFIVEK
ncbi:UNVERIFIED_CONTAM: 3-dehydroquinate synthase [Sesamum angustifolium]|uniref:3-dehydroquinate synthase n=1 Tax=Sesamum angustifolium TaxID=2727405 RepID=A0AAW2NMV9_9LAMI